MGAERGEQNEGRIWQWKGPYEELIVLPPLFWGAAKIPGGSGIRENSEKPRLKTEFSRIPLPRQSPGFLGFIRPLRT